MEMDDLTGKINEILGNPEQLEQIKRMASAMGLSGMQEQPKPAQAETASTPDLSAFMKFAPMMNLIKSDDETICFLTALRPLLGEERRKKVDEAIKILRLLKLFPLLKNAGILSSFF